MTTEFLIKSRRSIDIFLYNFPYSKGKAIRNEVPFKSKKGGLQKCDSSVIIDKNIPKIIPPNSKILKSLKKISSRQLRTKKNLLRGDVKQRRFHAPGNRKEEWEITVSLLRAPDREQDSRQLSATGARRSDRVPAGEGADSEHPDNRRA